MRSDMDSGAGIPKYIWRRLNVYPPQTLSEYEEGQTSDAHRFPELTMPLAFCDLNFIVTAHQGVDAYKDHLRQLAGNGTVTFVLSPMHWVEAAEDANPARGAAKADFMDGLQARWIYERRSVQGKETAAAFFRFLGIQGNPPQ